MPVKVNGGVEVPTMEEFNALKARVAEIERRVVIDGDNISLVSKSRGEVITWTTGGGEIKSLPGPGALPDDQVWTVHRK